MARRMSETVEWKLLANGEPLSAGEIEERAFGLLLQMTLTEKIAQMSGDSGRVRGVATMARAYNMKPMPAGGNARLGIPAIQFSDGPRGVVVNHSTCFPVSMARGATWDVALEARVGDAMGVEARSLGANFLAAVCINVLRHPAWGRAQETYGEDPYHLGEMGVALVQGLQRHVMACVKHYACNSIENSRMKVNIRIGERALREIYLRHFKRCVDAGAASVMSAYNQVNGDYCGHNTRLLREILKEEWGFDGFVMSDFVFGIRDARAAALAGMDMEMPFRWHYVNNLEKLVRSGEVPEAVIDEAVMRILRQKLRFAQVGEPDRYGERSGRLRRAPRPGARGRAEGDRVAEERSCGRRRRTDSAVGSGAPRTVGGGGAAGGRAEHRRRGQQQGAPAGGGHRARRYPCGACRGRGADPGDER